MIRQAGHYWVTLKHWNDKPEIMLWIVDSLWGHKGGFWKRIGTGDLYTDYDLVNIGEFPINPPEIS